MTTDKIEKLSDTVSELASEVARLCEAQKNTSATLTEIRTEIKEIRKLNDDVSELKAEKNVLRWVIGLLIPASLAGGGVSGWMSQFLSGGGQ